MNSFKRIRIASIRLKNFKSYDDYRIDFVEGATIQRVLGLFGPNGTGKSTMLDAIGMLFRNYCGSDRERMMTSLKKYVRNVKNMDVAGEFAIANEDEEMVERSTFMADSDDFFVIEGDFIVEDGTTYTVAVSNNPSFYEWSNQSPDGKDRNDSGRVFITGLVKDHPPEIRKGLTNQCYTTSYDKELNRFQLRKDRWSVFKALFEAVTGFPVEKADSLLDSDEEGEKSASHLDDYVLGITIHKPYETITERQCSDGEKKIIKNFTTLLNKDCVPSIILIDNIEMHVEVDRHMVLLDSVRKCFPDSQIIYTTHSERIISEADLRGLVSLVNKKIDRSQMWRQAIMRVLKGFKVSFKDPGSQKLCGSLFADLVNEKYNDIDGAKKRLRNIAESGTKTLEEEIDSIG